MKKITFLSVLLLLSLASLSQVKISDMPAYTGSPLNFWAPGIKEGSNYRYNLGNLIVDTTTINSRIENAEGTNINSIVFSGSETKTLTAHKASGAWITATFTDNDNQSISWEQSSNSLSISGGNTIHIPVDYKVQSFTGLVTSSISLETAPIDDSNVIIVMNTGTLHEDDYFISGNVINLSFTSESSDHFKIYYK